MGRKRYLKIVLPVLLIVIIGSVTSCFMFFMDWSGEDDLLEGDWIYTDSAINEVVTLTITTDTIVMVFDEDNPVYYMGYQYFNDWGFKGDLSKHDDIFDINIYELYRYYSYWYTTTPVSFTSRTGGGYFATSGAWPWTTIPNYNYSNFLNNYPGGYLGAAGSNITCTYSLDGDSLTLTFSGGSAGSYDFTRQ